MTAGPAPTPPMSTVPRGGGTAAVAFVAVAVVALAVVPLVMGGPAARARAEIAETLAPARLLGTRLSLVQARQWASFQAFLLIPDPGLREPYMQALREEQAILEELQALIGGLDLENRERLARLSFASARWHVEHQAVFDSEDARLERVAAFAHERARFEEMQQATQELERAIESQVDAGRRRAEGLSALQTRISLGLLLLGLGATLAVSLVGNRLRTLAAEADARRRDAELARREMDALLAATADGVMGVDLRGRILSLNRAGAELLGWTEAELEGEDVHDTLHHTTREGQQRARSESPLLRALASGAAMAGSPAADVFWRKDGSPLPVQWSLRPMPGGLLLRGGVLTFTDLTEIARQEEALHRAVRVREEVVSVVSHDLRNPLGVVAAAADLLLELPLDEPERRRQAEIIRRSADRMGRLVENLLDMARLEAGALVVRPAAQGAADILAEVEAYFAPQARARGVALQVEVGPSVPPVLADPDRVQQALANLVANALKHSPDGGNVVLGAHEHAGGGVALTVRDEGPGIPAENLPHLFDRFWQASRHDRTGTGLGLAIVRGIAEAHGGSVEVASELGKGALFSLVLPTPERGAGPREGKP